MKKFNVWFWSQNNPGHSTGQWHYIATASAVDEAIACQIVEARLRLKGRLMAYPHSDNMEAA